MHIKRFEADTMEEAIEQVRATLGPDALILSTRTVARARGAFGLLSRSGVEIQAAVPRAGSGERTVGRLPEAGVARALGTVEAMNDRSRPGDAGEGAELRALVEGLRFELRGLRSELGRVLAARPAAEGDRDASRLVEAGLDEIHARSLLEAAEAARSEGRPRSLESILAARLDARLAPPRSDGAGRVRILVGAPGAGKTTTLAKLAARNEEGERDVSLVSLDPFRTGARETLRAYAGLLEVPFEAISSTQAVADVARRHRDHAILVDTAGRSPGDLAHQLPLEALRAGLGEEASIELVLDATARREVARSQFARFAGLRADRLILTKLDECDSLVPIVNLLLDEGCPPVCWLGTGQRVPEDLEIAEPERFVQSVMGRAA